MKHAGNIFQRLIAFLVRHEWLVVVLFGIFVLRIPTLFDPHWYGDEEIYLVMGQGLRKGLVFYRDIFDHKPPVIYLLAAIVQTVFWFRILLMAVHAVSVVLFARLSELFFKNRRTMMAATGIYAVFSTLPLLEGTIANGENFMTVPAILAMYLLYKAVISTKKTAGWTYWWVGFWFAIAFLVKVPIGFDFVAAGLFWWLYAIKDQSFWVSVRRLFSAPLLLMLLGFFVPVLLSVWYYALVGAFEPYVRSVLLQNIGYINSWKGEPTSPLSNPLVWRMLVIAGFSLLALLIKKRSSVTRPMLFVSLWLLFATYGALLSNRPYPHYLLQPLIPAVFLAGLLIDKVLSLRRSGDLFLGISSLVLSGVMLANVGFDYYPTVSYYRNFIDYIRGAKSTEQFEAYFPSALSRNKKVADFLRTRTAPTERVFIWGEEPAIYDMADRLPVGRYMVSFHIRDFPNGYAETYQALVTAKPKYILVIPGKAPDFPALNTLLQIDYLEVTRIDDVIVYMYIEPKLVLNQL